MKVTAIAALMAIMLAACATERATSTPGPSAARVPPPDAVNVAITVVDIGTGEVTVRGEKPTPCDELGSIIMPTGDAIEIEIWAEPSEESCAQVAEPFDLSFDFAGAEIGKPIRVNGQEVGRTSG